MTIWKFLHIAAMFGAVSVFVGQGLLSARVAATGDVAAIRRVSAAEERFAPLGGGLFVLGIVFGVVTTLTGPLDLTAGWLIASYVLVAGILALGIGYHNPRGKKLHAAAEESPGGVPSEELQALIAAPSAKVVNGVDGLLWLGVLFLMVVKPF